MPAPSTKPYDHRRFAGNQGDVWKHALLLEVAAALSLNKNRFTYLETHAGPGMSPLAAGGEWQRGVARLGADPFAGRVADYVARAEYPGSWRLVADLLGDRAAITLCETSADVRAEAASRLPLPAAVTVHAGDGFAFFARHAAAFDLSLIDPVYRRDHDDWGAAAQAGAAGTTVLIWYPVFGPTNPARLRAGAGLAAHELVWDPTEKTSFRSKGAGVLASPAADAVLRRLGPRLAALASSLGGTYHVR